MDSDFFTFTNVYNIDVSFTDRSRKRSGSSSRGSHIERIMGFMGEIREQASVETIS